MIFTSKRHPAYDHMDPHKTMGQRHGNQAGDPKKGGQAMYELAVLKDPPLRVVIGSDAYARVYKKIKDYGENYKKYEKISNSTDVEGWVRPS